MKKLLLSSVFALLFVNYAVSQATFQKVYDIIAPDGSSNSIMPTSDGGYIVGANNDMGAQTNFYLLKLNTAGSIQWSKMFGGNLDDELYEVSQTTDGGYFCSGYSQSFSTPASTGDFYAVKTDGSGNLVWSATYGGSGWDVGTAGIQTADGGYIMTGWTASFGAGSDDVYVVKIDGSGNIQWTRTFGGSGMDQGYAIKQTSDGGYVIAGRTASFGAGGDDVYVIKITSGGGLQWSKTFGGTSGDECRSIQQTSDGGYIIGAYATSFSTGGLTYYVIKTDASGNPTWQKLYTDNNGGDNLNFIIQTNDGGYAFSGLLNTPSMNPAASLIKLDANGIMQWGQAYGGTVSENFYGKFFQTIDGGYILSGGSGSFAKSGTADVYVVKTNSSGSSGCFERAVILNEIVPPASIGSGGGTGSGGAKANPPTIVTTPTSTMNTVCSNDDGGIGIQEYYGSFASINLYPNPSTNQSVTLQVVANSSFDSEIQLTDNVGRIVYNSKEKIVAGANSIPIKLTNLASGFFFAHITNLDNAEKHQAKFLNQP